MFQVQDFDVRVLQNINWDLFEEVFVQIDIFQIRGMLFSVFTHITSHKIHLFESCG